MVLAFATAAFAIFLEIGDFGAERVNHRLLCLHLLGQTFARYQAIDQAQTMRFCRINNVAQKEKFLRLCRAHVPGQQPRRAEITAEPDLGIGCPEFRLLRRDAQIA